MDLGLRGRRVAILATDGVEQVELEEPRRALDAAGAITHLVAPEEGSIQAMIHDEKGARIPVDRILADVRPSDYDALLLPGGVGNPDRLRTNERAVQFVREFMLADKPVAAICHASWMLVEANAVAGRTLTEDDRASDPQPVAVISYDFWQRRFGLDPGVVGRKNHPRGFPFHSNRCRAAGLLRL